MSLLWSIQDFLIYLVLHGHQSYQSNYHNKSAKSSKNTKNLGHRIKSPENNIEILSNSMRLHWMRMKIQMYYKNGCFWTKKKQVKIMENKSNNQSSDYRINRVFWQWSAIFVWISFQKHSFWFVWIRFFFLFFEYLHLSCYPVNISKMYISP